MKTYYLDYAATSPVHFANPHSVHTPGIKAGSLVKNIEDQIKEKINGEHGKLFWFGSGSQANNYVMSSLKDYTACKYITPDAHKSVSQWRNAYSIDQLDETRTPVKLLSFIEINNETGVFYNNQMETGAALLGEEPLWHLDCVQSLGKKKISVTAWDAITLSAHKNGGPKGLALLWLSNRILEDKRFHFPYTGTPPVEMMGLFIDLLDYDPYYEVKMEALNHTFKQILVIEGIEYVNHFINHNKTCSILNLEFPNIDNVDLIMTLSDRGVYASAGSACNSDTVEPSPVLMSYGLTKEQAGSSVRFSFGKQSIEEIEEAAQIVANTVKELS